MGVLDQYLQMLPPEVRAKLNDALPQNVATTGEKGLMSAFDKLKSDTSRIAQPTLAMPDPSADFFFGGARRIGYVSDAHGGAMSACWASIYPECSFHLEVKAVAMVGGLNATKAWHKRVIARTDGAGNCSLLSQIDASAIMGDAGIPNNALSISAGAVTDPLGNLTNGILILVSGPAWCDITLLQQVTGQAVSEVT